MAGAITYAEQPAFPTAADEALICCAVPAGQAGGEPEPLVLEL